MSFYTLIFKKTISVKYWLRRVMISVFSISTLIVSINYIVDPYNITQYNILNIKYKFARNDRVEKLNYFKTLDRFDNILIGSSRVYSINPTKVSDIIGGKTYNFGVGTATVEDHLGIIKYLQRTDKLPKNIIIGIDFYTFNPYVPANKYFLKNKELNFLSFSNYNENYLGKFFSLDALKASIKTLKNHVNDRNLKPRFNKLGLSGTYEDYSLRNEQKDIIKAKQESEQEIKKVFSNYKYTYIDKKRIAYYEEIRKICNKNNIKLYIFTTPLHPILLNLLYKHDTKYALNEYLNYLSSFENFTNLFYDKRIYNNLRNFHGATHTSTNAGDIIIDIVLKN